MKLSCCILAGGKGSRFGGNKHKIKINGEWLIQSQINELSGIANEIIVVAKKRFGLKLKGAKIIYDKFKGHSASYGIITGLKAVKNKWALFLACDMPCIDIGVIKDLYRKKKGVKLVVPKYDGKLQMLYALYNKSAIRIIKQRIRIGERTLHSLTEVLPSKIINYRASKIFNPFVNINYKADLTTLK
ncbi:MAG: molybdenum cofactor guanylyltransferase [Planctomycetes bacterium]|nr:molybdenum cofactor guanylyltransferase [Planctomycetota bacterium]